MITSRFGVDAGAQCLIEWKRRGWAAFVVDHLLKPERSKSTLLPSSETTMWYSDDVTYRKIISNHVRSIKRTCNFILTKKRHFILASIISVYDNKWRKYILNWTINPCNLYVTFKTQFINRLHTSRYKIR